MTLTSIRIRVMAAVTSFLDRDSGLGEVGSGLGTALWGAIMLLGHPLPTWRSLDLLLALWDSPKGWGLIELAVGLWQLIAYGLTDQRGRSPWGRLGAAWFLAVLWGFNTVGAVWVKDVPPWASLIGTACAVNLVLVVRIIRAHCKNSPDKKGQVQGREETGYDYHVDDHGVGHGDG